MIRDQRHPYWRSRGCHAIDDDAEDDEDENKRESGCHISFCHVNVNAIVNAIVSERNGAFSTVIFSDDMPESHNF